MNMRLLGKEIIQIEYLVLVLKMYLCLDYPQK